MIIQNVSQILIILMKAKSGNGLPKSPKLLPLKGKNFSQSFLSILMKYCILKETVRGST